MTKFLALNISVSHDGFMAGPNQSEDNPLGQNGELLHSWAFATQAFQEWHGENGKSGGSTGTDNEYIRRGFENIGATIMGRNMFGPIRGSWPNDDWKGWWGPNPGYQHQVFILTHHSREPIDMGNGTVFIFVTEGIEVACEKAVRAAKGKDVRVGGGAQTIQQFLELGLLDELHVALVPVMLNSGEELFTDKALQLRRYRTISPVMSDSVAHQTYVRN